MFVWYFLSDDFINFQSHDYDRWAQGEESDPLCSPVSLSDRWAQVSISSWTPAVTCLYGSESRKKHHIKYFCSHWTEYLSTSVNVLLLSHTSQMTEDTVIMWSVTISEINIGTNSWCSCDLRLRPPTKLCTLFSVFKEIILYLLI